MIWLSGNKYSYHRIFGHADPDKKSERLILISCYTEDVEGNPFKLKYGAHYTTYPLDSINLKFKGYKDKFAIIEVSDNRKLLDQVYFEKRFLEFGNK